jgi:N-glycosylase/DNA lyase
MLALDADLAPLHKVAPTWIRDVDGGRLLRSPTVWEDLAKTLATTNCSWAATRGMVRRLVATLGAQGPSGERAFPTPAAVAAAGEDHLRDVIRAGYRARSFIELAEFCDGSEQRWLAGSRLDDETVMTQMLALRGFGRYAVEGMLGLLGRPRGFAVDSWIRAVLGKDEKTIAREYAKYGVWAGSVLWLDVTRHWFDSRSDPP